MSLELAVSRPEAEFLEASASIGAHLCRDALWSGKRVNWVGSSMEFIDNTWVAVQRSFGGEFYNGTSGIALFLGRLFRLTGETEFGATSLGAQEHALLRVHEMHPHARHGFYSGALGIIYTALELGRTEQALELLETLSRDDAGEQGLDVISGSAGAIPVLLNIYQTYPRDFLMDLAVRHGEHLLQTAHRNGEGWTWNTLSASTGRHLTGFSHGTAGIAWGLLELFLATGKAEYRQAALHALAYERIEFSRQHANWPDFRTMNERIPPGTGEPSYSVAWCHGAPGIGLSRLRAYSILKDDSCLAEAEIALATTMQLLRETALANQNFSLCHGAGGNAELPLDSAEMLGRRTLRAAAENVGWYGIEAYLKARRPWPCGVVPGGETPNLMLGLAGIGHFYLRLYDSAKVPSVLIVGPPTTPSGPDQPGTHVGLGSR
jgi:lantibiotic modifying enzyme